ncbi:MAG: hypothetical protein WCE48_07480, partial [Steroidobacteraceae bacterium]
ALFVCLVSPASRAVDAIVLEAAEVRSGAARATGVSLRLDLLAGARTVGRLRASRLLVSDAVGTLSGVDLVCRDPVLRGPRYACPRALVSVARSPLGPLAMAAAGEYLSDRSAWAASGSGIRIANGTARLSVRADAQRWSADGALENADVAALRRLADKRVPLPADYAMGGTASVRAQLGGRSAIDVLAVTAHLAPFELSNLAGTVVAEKLAADLALTLRAAGSGYAVELGATSAAGQALAGPVLLDLKANPVRFAATGQFAAGALELRDLNVHCSRLLDARGSATLSLRAAPSVRHARLTIDAFEFPAAYTSFLQIALAATDFSSLATTGRVTGDVELADDAPRRFTLRSDGLDLVDTKERVHVRGLAGEVNWVADPDAAVLPSRLAWKSGGAYGLSGGEAHIEFVSRALAAALSRPARIPIFDGALAVRSLQVHDLGKPSLTLAFDAGLEPISMPLLSRAFHWPELSGTVSGHIPALAYRDRTLTFGGDVVANVFDGTIRGSNIRLQDPLGPWPRLFASLAARNLDLELVTRTFAVGTITGRLEGDIRNLELFRWSPVAFDARLATPRNDPGPHRISAKAVGNLSNIGGGGGKVISALQSGMLRYFQEFGYDQLGIQCRLRNDVCLMSGVQRAGIGYYIVKGKGLPRVDIVGNQGRVNWRQLVSQIVAGMTTEGITVR